MKLLQHLYDQDTVDSMAMDLRRLEAWHSETDAIRALLGRYTPTEIALMVDDARRAAAMMRGGKAAA